jgi:hypothetical protein
MNKRLLLTCVALLTLHAREACAQFTDPRNYDNTAIGINQLEFNYAYLHANASIDTSLIVTGANLDLNQGTIDYKRYFGFLHRLMWLEAAVPVAGLGGSVSGTTIQGSTTGAGDSSYQVAMLFKGGPALTVVEFQNHRPTTTLGGSFTITAPTGLYNSNRILNLGSDRWSFKPEIAFTHPFGAEQHWEFNAYANVAFYTDNTSYHGKQILGQDPIPGFEGHISYSFSNSIWASVDARYSSRGTTFLNNLSQNNRQQNFILGSEMGISLSSRNSLLLEFAKAVAHHNGPALVGFSVRYDYTWGKGL